MLISLAAMRAAGYLPFPRSRGCRPCKDRKGPAAGKVRDLRRFLDCLHVGKISPLQDLSDVGSIDPGLLPTFETAFLEHLHLRFQYRDAKGRQTAREVEPQAMLVLPPLWYLVAWDPARADFRNFRMDRVTKPGVVAGRTFRKRHVPFDNDVCPYSGLR